MSEPDRPEVPEQIKLEDAPSDEPRPRRFKGLLYVLSILTGVMLLVCGGTIFAIWLYARSVDKSIDRVDAFTGLDVRPSKATPEAINILLLGSDSRAERDEPESRDNGARTDTII